MTQTRFTAQAWNHAKRKLGASGHTAGDISKRPALDQLIVHHVDMPANVIAPMLF